MVTLESVGLKVTASQTTPSKPGKAPRPVSEVSGLTGGFEDLLYSLGGKKWRRAFSFWHDPTAELLEALQTAERTSFAERKEGEQERAAERAERYRGYAANAEAKSEAAHEKFRAILDPIPLGQPILVGHYSEARHRKALSRADAALGKAVQEADKAKHYKSRAFSSSCKAEGHDVGFMARRLKESEAELRRLQRVLADSNEDMCGKYSPDIIERENLRFGILISEYKERVAYWQQQIDEAGGVPVAPTPEKPSNINKGDYVYSDRDWWQVIRVNAKTVTAQCLLRGCDTFKPKIPYAEIEKVITAGEYEAAVAKKEASK